MTTVTTQKQLAKGVGRTDRTIREWMARPDWSFPRAGPFNVEAVRKWAIERGLYDRLGSDPAGVSGGESSGGANSKMKEAASVYSLKQRIANLEYTKAKTDKIIQEMKARERETVPVAAIYPSMCDLAGQLRELAVQLLKRGNEQATEAALMIQDKIEGFEAKARTVFGQGGGEDG